MGMTSAGWSGANDQICGAPSFVRSSAYTLLGNEVCTYITFPTTSGLPSCPRNVPVDMVHAVFNCPMLAVVIWLSGLYRCRSYVRPGITHCLSSFAIDV